MMTHEQKIAAIDTACEAMYMKLHKLNEYHENYSAEDYEQVLDNIKDIYTIKAMRGEYGPHAQLNAHHHAQAQTPAQHHAAQSALV